MASLTFSATVMDDIRAAMRQQRQQQCRRQRASLTPAHSASLSMSSAHREDHDGLHAGDYIMDDAEVYESGDRQKDTHDGAVPCGRAKHVFDSWVQDLDDQTLPELDNDELRILHALLFGAGDDAFAVADELLKQTLASSPL